MNISYGYYHFIRLSLEDNQKLRADGLMDLKVNYKKEVFHVKNIFLKHFRLINQGSVHKSKKNSILGRFIFIFKKNINNFSTLKKKYLISDFKKYIN